MREKTTFADRYLLEHFYETCFSESKSLLNCSGVVIDMPNGQEYSWIDVLLNGERQCRNCAHVSERQGFYLGKGKYSANFGSQEYVTLNNVRSDEEFASVCENINPDVKGIVMRAAILDPSLLERFSELEFVVFENQRISRFWNTAYTPKLKAVTLWMNKHLKSLDGLENAENLECLQFYSSFSDTAVHKINSFKAISKLPKLRDVVISATEPLDCNIDYLIDLPSLEYLWIAPNLFPVECYAKFEAKRFKLSEEYGIYCEETGDVFPYGKGKRVIHTHEQKEVYLRNYNELMLKHTKSE